MYNVLDVAIYVINYAYDAGCGEFSCRPIKCPLKPLPEEDHEDHYPDEWEDGEDAN